MHKRTEKLNIKLEEKEILRDLNKAIDDDALDINSKVSSLFENLEVEEYTAPSSHDVSVWQETLSEILTDFGIENPDELATRIMDELNVRGLL